LVTSAPGQVPSATPTLETTDVVGLVVAYGLFPGSGLNIEDHNQMSSDLIFRIDRIENGAEPAKYIRVSFRFRRGEKDLPEAIHDGKTIWRLKLHRDSECDQKLSMYIPIVDQNGKEDGRVPALWRPVGTENEPLPESGIAPCYLLAVGNFKANQPN
jgi:hypothetical protein